MTMTLKIELIFSYILTPLGMIKTLPDAATGHILPPLQMTRLLSLKLLLECFPVPVKLSGYPLCKTNIPLFKRTKPGT
jgi:hypothetical protein